MCAVPAQYRRLGARCMPWRKIHMTAPWKVEDLGVKAESSMEFKFLLLLVACCLLLLVIGGFCGGSFNDIHLTFKPRQETLCLFFNIWFPLLDLINHWFPLIRPCKALISEGGTLGGRGGRLTSYDSSRSLFDANAFSNVKLLSFLV